MCVVERGEAIGTDRMAGEAIHAQGAHAGG